MELNPKDHLLNCGRFVKIATNILNFLFYICQNNQKCQFLFRSFDKEQILFLALKEQVIVIFDIIPYGKPARLNNKLILNISITKQFMILYYNDVYFNY